MRSAVSRFIECISLSNISLPEKIKHSLLDTLNENMRHPNSQIQVFPWLTNEIFLNFFGIFNFLTMPPRIN